MALTNTWLRDGSLVYRLGERDGYLQNVDEINVTMVGGSREEGPRYIAALALQKMLNSNEEVRREHTGT